MNEIDVLYQKWSAEEIGRYADLRVKNNELGLLYALAGIPISEPEKRAKYLADKLNLTASDQGTFSILAKAGGRPLALQTLEMTFMANFF